MATPRTPESGVSRVDTQAVLGLQLERPANVSELAVEKSVQEALLDYQVHKQEAESYSLVPSGYLSRSIG